MGRDGDGDGDGKEMGKESRLADLSRNPSSALSREANESSDTKRERQELYEDGEAELVFL